MTTKHDNEQDGEQDNGQGKEVGKVKVGAQDMRLKPIFFSMLFYSTKYDLQGTATTRHQQPHHHTIIHRQWTPHMPTMLPRHHHHHTKQGKQQQGLETYGVSSPRHVFFLGLRTITVWVRVYRCILRVAILCHQRLKTFIYDTGTRQIGCRIRPYNYGCRRP